VEPSWREEDETGMNVNFWFVTGFLTERSDAAIVWRLAQTRRRHFGHNGFGNSDGIRGMGAGSTRKNDGAEAFAPPDAIDRPSSTISSEARTMYEQYHLKAEKFQQQPPSD